MPSKGVAVGLGDGYNRFRWSPMESPISVWRKQQGLTREALAKASGLSSSLLRQVEEGKTGIPGELQDYLTTLKENVSLLASEQSFFVASRRIRPLK